MKKNKIAIVGELDQPEIAPTSDIVIASMATGATNAKEILVCVPTINFVMNMENAIAKIGNICLDVIENVPLIVKISSGTIAAGTMVPAIVDHTIMDRDAKTSATVQGIRTAIIEAVVGYLDWDIITILFAMYTIQF
ncbi:unnamed protein product [Gordionus sp. m RMFG-2023]